MSYYFKDTLSSFKHYNSFHILFSFPIETYLLPIDNIYLIIFIIRIQ
nr:MAG TPA: hypothetical protein [Caudoviricetes sp.]